MQSHDNTDERPEPEDNLEPQVSILGTQALSTSEENAFLKKVFTSLRLRPDQAGEETDGKQAGEERGGSPAMSGRWWLAEKTVALVSVVAGGLCVLIVWMGPGRDDSDVNKELVAAWKRVSVLEADLEKYTENPSRQTKELNAVLASKKEQGAALESKDAEIQRLRLEALRRQKEIDGLRSNLSSSEKDKDRKIAALEESIAWIKGENRKEINEVRSKKSREIEILQSKVNHLNTIKGVAIPGLIDALDHKDLEVRTTVAKTLTELTRKTYGTDQEKWRKWWRQNRIKFIRR